MGARVWPRTQSAGVAPGICTRKLTSTAATTGITTTTATITSTLTDTTITLRCCGMCEPELLWLLLLLLWLWWWSSLLRQTWQEHVYILCWEFWMNFVELQSFKNVSRPPDSLIFKNLSPVCVQSWLGSHGTFLGKRFTPQNPKLVGGKKSS